MTPSDQAKAAILSAVSKLSPLHQHVFILSTWHLDGATTHSIERCARMLGIQWRQVASIQAEIINQIHAEVVLGRPDLFKSESD